MSFEGNYHAALTRIVALEQERDALNYEVAHDKAYIGTVENLLREAHDEMTNHGHQELSECDCKIARELNFAASDAKKP